MTKPAAPVAIIVGINRYANEEPTPVEVTKAVMAVGVTKAVMAVEVTEAVMAMVAMAPSNRTDQVGRAFAEVGLNGR
jgi:hypothetical protein